MTRNPKSKERDAWKRWLRDGWRLFDRTWSGWTLAWWLFSLGVVYVVGQAHNLLAVGLLSFASAAAFGMHIAVFDVLAAGKRGPTAWLSAAWSDLVANRWLYARTGAIRGLVALGCVIVMALIVLVFVWALPDSTPPAAKAIEQPFWKAWVMWSWMWMIPAGWQKGGALGWGHWLLRREGADLQTAELLTRIAIALNTRSYAIAVGILMAGSIFLMFAFPPLMPVWDVYAAAVCWCIWDEIFGTGEGLREMEKKPVAVSLPSLSGI